MSAIAERAEAATRKMLEGLQHEFFLIGVQDAPLAVAIHSQCELLRDGDFTDALTLHKAIGTRLELLVRAAQANFPNHKK